MEPEPGEDLASANMLDVTSTRLSALLRHDPALDSAIRDLVSQLKAPPEVTLAWNNYVSRSSASPDPDSIS